MFNCTTPNYANLYARWLENPGKLLDFARYDPNTSLLDVCGGTGVVLQEALRRGALQVGLVDINPRLPPTLDGDARVTYVHRGRLEYMRPQHPWWDVAVCRQGLGYLDLPQAAEALRGFVRYGGSFVFNTFVRPKFGVKAYVHRGALFVETSAFWGKRVFHIQSMLGDWDLTTFTWHTPRDVEAAFLESGAWKLHAFKRTETSLWYHLKRTA